MFILVAGIIWIVIISVLATILSINTGLDFEICACIVVGSIVIFLIVYIIIYSKFEDKKRFIALEKLKSYTGFYPEYICSYWQTLFYKCGRYYCYIHYSNEIKDYDEIGYLEMFNTSQFSPYVLTGYSNFIAGKRDMAVGAIGAILNINYIYEMDTNDNCITLIGIQTNSGKIIPCFRGELEVTRSIDDEIKEMIETQYIIKNNFENLSNVYPNFGKKSRLNRKPINKKKFAIIASIIATVSVLTIFFVSLFTKIIPSNKYNRGLELIEEGNYEEAKEVFEGLNYNDSIKKLSMINAKLALEVGDCEKAIDYVYKIDGTTNILYMPSYSKVTIKRYEKSEQKDNYLIEAPSKDGNKFIKWEIKKCELSFEKYELNLTLEAVYEKNEYKLSIADNVIYSITGLDKESTYKFEDNISLFIKNVPINEKLIWKLNGKVIGFGSMVNFDMPSKDSLITVESSNNEYYIFDQEIYFGLYPQSKITDNSLIVELNDLAGALPTSTNLYKWTDYSYYAKGSITSYMYYQDIDYNGDGTNDFRGVYFCNYRPYSILDESNYNNSYQYSNGYEVNTVYWFRYDPIKWSIISKTDDRAFIMSELILDSQEFYPSSFSSSFNHNGGTGYANNYELSKIRKWLNDTFFNTSFNDTSKGVIETTTVSNDYSTSESSTKKYLCGTTYDKVFLLSYNEAKPYKYDNVYATEYANVQGLYNSKIRYWLRSPGFDLSTKSGSTKVFTTTKSNILYDYVYYISLGVRPACNLIL